ncbi:hypothetical protein D9615_007232 [Tricholomella constricta]|uniref:CENP-V/GFA domain-containing protein n=1 Tax=Tricholomella constricta TaxID=117010 RepID=A0A8H5H5V1_9AGAR|nr:hypothetical protein D9615_007232 [Tricholomella constricta]
MAKIYHGSCLCDSVQFTMTGEPFTYFVCHCKNCQKSSGSAFMANAFFKPEQVVITKGKEHVKVYIDAKTKSGEVVPRSFCSSCGSSLFLGNEEKLKIVASGTVEEEVDWVPRRESFAECKRQWIEGIKTNPKRRSKL